MRPMVISTELQSAALIAVRDCMGAQPGERVLVVTDERLRADRLRAATQAAATWGNEVAARRDAPAHDQRRGAARRGGRLMTKVDVVLCPTSKSLTHTDSRRAASAKGVRVATLPGVTEEIMVRCMNADYHAHRRSARSGCAT